MVVKISPYWLLEFLDNDYFVLKNDTFITEDLNYLVKDKVDKLGFWLKNFLSKDPVPLKINTRRFNNLLEAHLELEKDGCKYIGESQQNYLFPPDMVRYYEKGKEIIKVFYKFDSYGAYEQVPMILNYFNHQEL